MPERKPVPGATGIKAGAATALLGLCIILWPERGLMPHPMPFPPSASERELAGYAVLGYPLLTLGLGVLLIGAIRYVLSTRRN